MTLKLPLILSFLLFFLSDSFSQDEGKILVTGRVLEMPDRIPVANVKVKIIGFGWAFTNIDGRFSVQLPTDREYIHFELEDCPYPVIKPYNKLVNLPPGGHLDIEVCARENNCLQEKINALDKKMAAMERQRKLSKRQLSAMHEALLDTILHFENKIRILENELEGKDGQLDEKNKQIGLLEQEVTDLQEQLVVALEEKYLRQQEYQLVISSCMENLIVKTKDLRDWLAHFSDYFRGPGAQMDFNKKNQGYEEAWEKLNLNHANYLLNIRNYWDGQLLEQEAKDLFQLALDDLHKRIIIQQYNRDVIRFLQEYSKQPYNNKIRKEAKKGAVQTLLLLNDFIPKLEEKNRLFQRRMIENT